MKFCSVCGKQYTEDAKFCGKCGVELKMMKQEQHNTDAATKLKNEATQLGQSISNIVKENITEENIAKVKETANEVVTTIKALDAEKGKALVGECKNRYNSLQDNIKTLIIIFLVTIIGYAGYSFLSPAKQAERVACQFMTSVVELSESDGINLSALEDMAECLEPKHEDQIRMMIALIQVGGMDRLSNYGNPFSSTKITKWDIVNTEVNGNEATVVVNVIGEDKRGYSAETGKIKLQKMQDKWRVIDMIGIK